VDDARGAEAVGLDQVGTRRTVGLVDLLDRVRTGQHQQVAVALEIRGVAAQARSPEILLLELLGLEHRAHGPVQDEDALGKQLLELLASVDCGHDLLEAYRARWRACRRRWRKYQHISIDGFIPPGDIGFGVSRP